MLEYKELFTIVIPCKNEEKYIDDLFESIINQDLKGVSEVPIVIADAASKDDTLQVIEKWKSKLNITVVEGGLPSVGRNNGAKIAQTKYIFFLDADIKLDKDIIRRTLDLAESKNLNGCSSLITNHSGKWYLKLSWGVHNLLHRFHWLVGPFSLGMFIFIRRDKLWELGGFDEKIQFAEDWHLTNKMKRKEFGVVDRFVYTSDRRVEKMGLWGMLKLYLSVPLMRNNPKFFYKDHSSYWKE